jgi:3-oxoacyl-[acyl-carrier-protein] synthase III
MSRSEYPGAKGRAAVLAGLGAWTPSTIVTNSELGTILGIDDAWIQSRTGIRQRHVVAPGESVGDLAVTAGRRALMSAGVASADAVVLATNTPDQPCPATAPTVASRLGLGEVPAFDVSAVCAGFVYGLATGSGLIAAGIADSVLVIGADAFSTIVNPADRATRPVFGDGAGAALLRAGSASEPGALLGLNLGSDGSLAGLAGIPAGGSRQRSAGPPAKHEDIYFTMHGSAVFSQAVRRMSASVTETTHRAEWDLGLVTWFVLHQANARILEATARRLDAPAGRFLSNIARVGNTAAASLPIALADGVVSGELRPGQRVVLASFGAGLAWGSVALTWPSIDVRQGKEE